ncbi:MAG: tetratricopeptide repeat protein [Fischerella sp.]|jgi:tetratricopeptide (TPR) repeat protein|uniref:tetratricopeptide repeat protein n=1 Tax=Fischerella sp. TaxID=1191 RepID=UPI00183FC7F2|nr:tetratricopeptide repeat protein [Fischerella sp.]NWF60637.1 tetratricopeptide repeat protein [Fischerella sp.]
MLKWLLQWLKRFWKFPFDGKQTASQEAVAGDRVVQQPPELTNADLEFLFTQLLEGVYQARGQHWAIKYLQRMEHRISVERWIEWLLDFGERLLTSPAPNNHLAERMMQLGELEIGTIGELAYDIGIRLLTRNLGEEYWETDAEAFETPAPVPITVPPPKTESQQNFQEWNSENSDQDGKMTASSLSDTPGIDLIRNLGELLWEAEEEIVVSKTSKSFIPYSENVKENTLAIAPTSFITPLEAVKENTATTPTNFIDPWQEKEYAWVKESLPTTTLDEPWTNSPPVTETTLDDLLVRLEQSTNLVQQIAVGLGIQTTDPHDIIEALSNQSNVNSTQPEDWFYQGLQQAKIGDLSGALISYNKAIEMRPDAYEYWFNRGLTLFYLGNFTEAIASYDRAIEIKPDFYKGWYNRGAALGELGNFAEAIASFDATLKLKGDYHEAWSGRGLMQLKLGDWVEAVSCFDASLELQPHDPENWYLRGIALAEGGQNHDAIASYDQALEFNPEFDLAWYRRGVTQFHLGSWEEAIANYRQAIEINPECYEAWYALAGATEKLGNKEDAIAAYDRATQIKPDFHEVWIDRGVLLANLGQWENAIASWDKAIAIDRNFYLTWFNRGVALDNLGRREEALASYDKAIEINPDFYLAWYNRGVAQFYLGRFEEAIASYDSALQIKPDYWEAWLGRGNAAGNAIASEWQMSMSSAIAASNHALNERGDLGKLASYQEGLKYISQYTHPEGWGRLHIAIGNAYYDRGKRHPTPRHHWLQAATAYEQALVTLTAEAFPLLHLEVLQNLIKTFVVLGETAQAQHYQQHAAYLLESLLNETTRSDESKKQLALKFAGLRQLAVDIDMQCGELAQGWEIAEYGKNACLTWLLYGWKDEIVSPSYTEVHQLLNPTTAIVYWHISPCTLRTFVIKYKSPEPIPIFTPVLNFASIDELPVPEAVARLIEFEDWVEQWNQQYQEYRSFTEDEQNKSKHSWHLDMEQRLLQLQNILNISAVIQELEDITHLILIPHRDLHRFPLHALFHLCYSYEKELPKADNFTITYLPSARIGLSLKSESIEKIDEKLLLSVEQPNISGYPKLKFAKIEAEVISQMFDNSQRIQESQVAKQQVENALFNDYNIFHFIGQLTDNLSQPDKSELVLTNEEKITLAEIWANSLLSYKLITISGGETAVTSPQTLSTEYVGLVSGLLTLGIPHIVSSLWTVESAASTLLMIEFYRRIKLNQSVTTALAEAIAWLKELTADELTKWYKDLLNQLPQEGLRIKAHLATEMYRSSQMPADKKVYNHPYYWAGFKVIGNFSE